MVSGQKGRCLALKTGSPDDGIKLKEKAYRGGVQMNGKRRKNKQAVLTGRNNPEKEEAAHSEKLFSKA